MRIFGVPLVITYLMLATLFAKDANPLDCPAFQARVVRVHIVYTIGMCGGGYCTSLATIEPSIITREEKGSSDPKRFPNKKTKYAITRKDWQNVQQVVDAKSLAAVPQEPCHAVIDLPCSSVEVEFSDGTKIRISYNVTNAPPPVAALLKAIQAIRLNEVPRISIRPHL